MNKYLRHKLIDSSLGRVLGKIYRNGFFIENLRAYMRVKKLSGRVVEQNRPIRVLFLGQCIAAWNKMEDIYQKMSEMSEFQAILLAVPEDIHNINNDVYRFFFDKYGDKVVNARENDDWVDLRKFQPDYVFYQRPYDQYLPQLYRSGEVSKYTKVCFVNYGFELLENLKSISFTKTFFRNVSIYFAEEVFGQEFNVKRFKKSHAAGYRKSVNVGYPILDRFAKGAKTTIEKHNFCFLWTPRWSEDKELGGSNFLKYKDSIISFMEQHPEYHLIFRPHPMTFSHFVSIGKMTAEQAREYISRYETNENMEYNNTADYLDIFQRADVMVTDVSSVMVEYFVMRKPIILCKTEFTPNSFFKKLMEGIYIAQSWEQVEEILDMLARGSDPLRQKREELVEELFGTTMEHAVESIMGTLIDDFK